MGWKIIVLSTLISLLTGCAPKPKQAPPPAGPGLSFQLSYPVLLAGDRNLKVQDDERSLITTTGASGVNFLQVKIIDAGGALYEVTKVTPFGKKNMALDMGTSQYQVFLELKRVGQINLKQAQAVVMEVVVEP